MDLNNEGWPLLGFKLTVSPFHFQPNSYKCSVVCVMCLELDMTFFRKWDAHRMLL